MTPPSNSPQGPLTILAGSQGFDKNNVYDFLSTITDNGQPLQALGLSFYNGGLAAGGIVNFSLNVANVSSPPQLVSQNTGVTITLDTASSSSGSSPQTSVNHSEVPEPLSLVLWSTLAGAGLLRVYSSRRARRVALHC